jgi:hypothetical protein
MRFQGMLAKAYRVQARRSRKSLEQHFPRLAIEEDLVTNQVPRIPNHAPATNSVRVHSGYTGNGLYRPE